LWTCGFGPGPCLAGGEVLEPGGRSTAQAAGIAAIEDDKDIRMIDGQKDLFGNVPGDGGQLELPF
jgi:hypothetical protein